MKLQQDIIKDAMLNPEFYPDPVDHVEFIETHISQVFLTGQYAYKVKKDVDFGFLDFTDLNKRKFYCEEELRLNGRLAPEIYLDVIPITKSQNRIVFNGTGTVIEYAIKMKQFDQHGLLSNLVKEDKLKIEHIIELSKVIAKFHQQISSNNQSSDLGTPDEILKPIRHNFEILKPILNSDQLSILNDIEQKTLTLHKQLTDFFIDRKNNGYIRECHGDLHLGNISLINNRVVPFDGIEFNDSFRWIDTMSEIAFLIMDLEDHKHHIYANEFLNRYLELTGDYQGLTGLRYYKIYRAMVRAKVTGLRLQQIKSDSIEYASDLDILNNYLRLARNYCNPETAQMIITHGISGSGKSWLTDQIRSKLNAITIHSDYERKRLYANCEAKLYSQDITERVYEYLLSCAVIIIHSGYSVIIDATFLNYEYRTAFRETAQSLGIKFTILDCIANTDLLESRIKRRSRQKNSMSDADINILHKQQENYRPLSDIEKRYTLTIDTGSGLDMNFILDSLNS